MDEKWKIEKSICWDQKGHKGGSRFDEYNAFDAIAINMVLWCQIFSFEINIVVAFATNLSSHFWFHFAIVRDVLMLLKYILETSFFVNHNMWWSVIRWHQCMTQKQKSGSVSQTSMLESNFYNIKLTLWHVQDMSTTVPTKMWHTRGRKKEQVEQIAFIQRKPALLIRGLHQHENQNIKKWHMPT